MERSELEAFVRIAALQSITQAADSLHLTQPAISKRLQSLEEDLGSRLFDRTGRLLRLTEAGEVLLPRAQDILRRLDEARHALHFDQDSPSGVLRLATSHYIGLYLLPDILREYTRRYPDVRLALTFTDSEIACQQVLDGTVDIALATLPPEPDPRLRHEQLWEDRMVLAVGLHHPLAGMANPDLEALTAWPAILPDERTFTHRLLRNLFGPQYLRLNIQTSTNYLETILMMVSIGLGWSILPDTMVRSRVDVMQPQLSLPLARRPLGQITHKGHTPSRAASALTALLAAQPRHG